MMIDDKVVTRVDSEPFEYCSTVARITVKLSARERTTVYVTLQQKKRSPHDGR